MMVIKMASEFMYDKAVRKSVMMSVDDPPNGGVCRSCADSDGLEYTASCKTCGHIPVENRDCPCKTSAGCSIHG